jgi:hypothetical protein
MRTMRYGFMVLALLLCAATSAPAQVSIGIGTPHVSIGVNLPVYPELVAVPNYPVYYAPRVSGNYFFYDGMYWVYEGDNWYASSWYDGPWGVVHRDVVPVFVLRVPVRYYRAPPVYFRGWRADAPPLWSVHWGREWEVRRAGWDRWDRRVVYARAPLPLYQRQYVGGRYPRAVEQQTNIHITNYNYHPRDTVVRAHLKEQVAKAPPEAQKRFAAREAAQVKREAAAKSAPGRREESAKSAKEFAPGQRKREEGAKSAKEFAPGQVKKDEGAKSAKEFAPGQQRKEQRAPEASSKGRDRDKDDGKGKSKGRGSDDDGKGKGKGRRSDDDGKGKGKGRGNDEERGRGRDK